MDRTMDRFVPSNSCVVKSKAGCTRHGPVRFSGACVWFRDVTSFSDASGMVCVRV